MSLSRWRLEMSQGGSLANFSLGRQSAFSGVSSDVGGPSRGQQPRLPRASVRSEKRLVCLQTRRQS